MSRKRQQSGQFKSLLHEIISIFAEEFFLDKSAPKILKTIGEALKFAEGELWRLDSINNVLRCVTVWSDGKTDLKEFIEATRTKTFAWGIGLPGLIWKNKGVSWMIDVTKDPNFPRAPLALKAGLHTGFGLPVLHEGNVVGVIVFFLRHVYDLNDELLSLFNEITRLLGIFIDRELTQKRMQDLSRQAGNAEIASVLSHNMGNALNSIHISVELLKKRLLGPDHDKLSAIADLINDNLENLPEYIQDDPRGKLIPEYLIKLASVLASERHEVMKELMALNNNIEYLDSIVAMQSAASGTSSVAEQICLPEVIDTAIRACTTTLKHENIAMIVSINGSPSLTTDKIKLQRILINLIMNAKNALSVHEVKMPDKKIIIEVKTLTDAPAVEIRIIDNGIGIASDTLKKIFSPGFVAQIKGHGFSLHNSSLAASELGGSLQANSAGLGQGATFVLTLPISLPTERRLNAPNQR